MTTRSETTQAARPLDRSVVRPGAGWKRLAGPVWEHCNGTRVHTMGVVRLPDMTFLSATKWPDSREADRFIRINGGNRKRGLMAWALAHNAALRGREAVPLESTVRPLTTTK